MKVIPLSPCLGAEVFEVDLSSTQSPQVYTAINDALLEHIVVVVRGQTMSPKEYVGAMRQFGAPGKQSHSEEFHPDHPEIWVIDSRNSEINTAGERMVFGSECWHTDHTHLERPPKITSLFAVQLPENGGDTEFVNAYRLYDRLAPSSRETIADLQVIYGADRHLKFREADRDSFSIPSSHPLVRTHPETGRRALYIHALKMVSIEGMTVAESDDLINGLLAESIDSTEIYRHKWQPGDLVLIDNRACLHKAARDYDPRKGRVMHRMTIEGERPM